MTILIILFLLCFAGIFITSYWSIESVKALAEKFKLSDTFVGAVFLSVGTSFPEFINSIISGFKDRSMANPVNGLYSFFNVTGANIWQIVFLVCVLAKLGLIYRWRTKTDDLDQIVDIFWKESKVSWYLVMMETVILFLLLSMPYLATRFLFKGFNILNLIFIGIWLWYLRWTYRNSSISKSQERSKYFSGWRKLPLVLMTGFLWLLFGALAYGNFHIASKFPLDSSTAFGIILSFITSSPEFFVLYFLFKQKEYKIAVGGFFGSSLFNLILPAFTNMISLNPILGRGISIDGKELESGHTMNTEKLGFWVLLNIVLLLLFLVSFIKKPEIRNRLLVPNAAVVLGLYAFMNLFINRIC